MLEVHRYTKIVRIFIVTAFVFIPVATFAGLFIFQTGTVARERATIQAERFSRAIAAEQDQQIRSIRNLLVSVG